MASVNEVRLLGRLGKDPELRYTQNQTAVCNMSLATSEYRKDQNGNKNEFTEWHRIQAWGNQAENCSKYLKKGSQAFVAGRLQTRVWEDNGQKKYSTEVVASSIQFLDPKEGRVEVPSVQLPSEEDSLSEIPF